MQNTNTYSVARFHVPSVWVGLDCGRYIPIVAYLLNEREFKQGRSWRDSFVNELDFGSSCTIAENVQQADFIVFPYYWKPDFASQFVVENQQVERLSQELRRPVVCHGNSADIVNPNELKLPFKHCYYLSASLIATKRPKNFLGLSYFIPDCRQKYARQPSSLPKSDRPSVGFCGVAAPFATEMSKTKIFDCFRLGLLYANHIGIDAESFMRKLGSNTKHAYRSWLILQFRRSPHIDCNFILRSSGGLVDNSYTNRSDFDSYNVDFYQNIENSIYTICTRGTENYSVRFYETLCMGRIPIVIDTDLVLPFGEKIDYRKHCVWINRNEISRASEILLEFHHQHSDSELCEIQHANRLLWESYLSHTTFYNQLASSVSNWSNI